MNPLGQQYVAALDTYQQALDTAERELSRIGGLVCTELEPKIREYLSKNMVGYGYVNLTDIVVDDEGCCCIELEHKYIDGDTIVTEYIDEDFVSDDPFEDFLQALAEDYGLVEISVPWNYYGK